VRLDADLNILYMPLRFREALVKCGVAEYVGPKPAVHKGSCM
jgi:hypothetical protein